MTMMPDVPRLLTLLLFWRGWRARRILAAASAEQAREAEAARQRLLYQARGGHHWSAARGGR